MSKTFKSFSSYPIAILNTDGRYLTWRKNLLSGRRTYLKSPSLLSGTLTTNYFLTWAITLKAGKLFLSQVN